MALRDDVKKTLTEEAPAEPVRTPARPAKGKRLWKVDLGSNGPVTPSPFFAAEHPTDPRLRPLRPVTGWPDDAERYRHSGGVPPEDELERRRLVVANERDAEVQNYLRGRPIEADSEAEAVQAFYRLHGIVSCPHTPSVEEITPEEAAAAAPPKRKRPARKRTDAIRAPAMAEEVV